MSGWGFVEALVCLEQAARTALLSTVPMFTVFPSGAAEAPRILGPVWGTVRGSARRLKPHSTLSAGASVGDQGLRKKCGHLFLFSLQSAGGECKVPVVGQARERVRIAKRTDSCIVFSPGVMAAPRFLLCEGGLMTCASAFFFSSWLDLCDMTLLQGPTLPLQ